MVNFNWLAAATLVAGGGGHPLPQANHASESSHGDLPGGDAPQTSLGFDFFLDGLYGPDAAVAAADFPLPRWGEVNIPGPASPPAPSPGPLNRPALGQLQLPTTADQNDIVWGEELMWNPALQTIDEAKEMARLLRIPEPEIEALASRGELSTETLLKFALMAPDADADGVTAPPSPAEAAEITATSKKERAASSVDGPAPVVPWDPQEISATTPLSPRWEQRRTSPSGSFFPRWFSSAAHMRKPEATS